MNNKGKVSIFFLVFILLIALLVLYVVTATNNKAIREQYLDLMKDKDGVVFSAEQIPQIYYNLTKDKKGAKSLCAIMGQSDYNFDAAGGTTFVDPLTFSMNDNSNDDGDDDNNNNNNNDNTQPDNTNNTGMVFYSHRGNVGGNESADGTVAQLARVKAAGLSAVEIDVGMDAGGSTIYAHHYSSSEPTHPSTASTMEETLQAAKTNGLSVIIDIKTQNVTNYQSYLDSVISIANASGVDYKLQTDEGTYLSYLKSKGVSMDKIILLCGGLSADLRQKILDEDIRCINLQGTSDKFTNNLNDMQTLLNDGYVGTWYMWTTSSDPSHPDITDTQIVEAKNAGCNGFIGDRITTIATVCGWTPNGNSNPDNGGGDYIPGTLDQIQHQTAEGTWTYGNMYSIFIPAGNPTKLVILSGGLGSTGQTGGLFSNALKNKKYGAIVVHLHGDSFGSAWDQAVSYLNTNYTGKITSYALGGYSKGGNNIKSKMSTEVCGLKPSTLILLDPYQWNSAVSIPSNIRNVYLTGAHYSLNWMYNGTFTGTYPSTNAVFYRFGDCGALDRGSCANYSICHNVAGYLAPFNHQTATLKTGGLQSQPVDPIDWFIAGCPSASGGTDTTPNPPSTTTGNGSFTNVPTNISGAPQINADKTLTFEKGTLICKANYCYWNPTTNSHPNVVVVDIPGSGNSGAYGYSKRAGSPNFYGHVAAGYCQPDVIVVEVKNGGSWNDTIAALGLNPTDIYICATSGGNSKAYIAPADGVYNSRVKRVITSEPYFGTSVSSITEWYNFITSRFPNLIDHTHQTRRSAGPSVGYTSDAVTCLHSCPKLTVIFGSGPAHDNIDRMWWGPINQTTTLGGVSVGSVAEIYGANANVGTGWNNCFRYWGLL